MRRLLVVAVGLFASIAALAAISGLAAAAPQPTRVVLRPKFALIDAGKVSGLVASGRYVGYDDLSTPGSPRFVVVDDQTGKRTVLDGCRPTAYPAQVVLGSSWVAFDCATASPRFQLYNLTTNRWRGLACDALCQRSEVFIAAIGARWLELGIAPHQLCDDGIHYYCGPFRELFYNLTTGQPRSAHVGPRSLIDLNAPTPVRPLCQPLRVPDGGSLIPPRLTFLTTSLAVAHQPSGFYLQRCGSRLHEPLAPGTSFGSLVGNTHAVGVALSRQITGVFLPSRRRFTATLPTNLSSSPDQVLGPRHLYAISPQAKLWAAAFPSQPPRSLFAHR